MTDKRLRPAALGFEANAEAAGHNQFCGVARRDEAVVVSVILIVLVIAPLEWFLLMGVAAGILAVSYLVGGDTEAFFYTRFAPLGVLALRSLLALATHQVRTRELPALFLKPFGFLFLFALFSTIYASSPNRTFLRAMTMGFTLLYLSLIVLIPLSTVLLKTATLSWNDFWGTVTSARTLAASAFPSMSTAVMGSPGIPRRIIGTRLAPTLPLMLAFEPNSSGQMPTTAPRIAPENVRLISDQGGSTA